MSQADVLREFLVGLGFKIDQAGMKRFEGSVEGVTKTVATLGTAVAAAATAVSAAVVKIASNLDNVYFASQRIKSSVENLNAFQYAARQMGVSAESAMGAMNNLASFMRKYPRSGDWFARFGVQTKDRNGKERDRADVMMDVAKKLRDMPEAQAINTGKFLGMDENLILAIRDGKFDSFFAQYKAMAKDANLKKASEDANKFMTALRGIIEEFKLLGIQVQAALLGQAGAALQKFKTWFDDNKPRIVKALTDISTILITIATEVIPVMVGALEIFIKLDEATDGWSTKVLLLAAAFRTLGGVAAFKFLMAGGSMAKMVAGRIFGVAGLALYSSSLNEGEELNENQGKPIGKVGGSANDMVKFFEDRGWSREQAAGIVANLHHESGLKHDVEGDHNKKTGKYDAYGLAQWHPDRQKEFKKVFGKDIRQSTREEQLAFVHYELTQGNEQAAGRTLRAQNTAGGSAAVVTTGYERPANMDAEAVKRAATARSILKNADLNSKATTASAGLGVPSGDTTYNQGKDVTINQNTTINVEGGGDSRETARNVVGAQAALNGNMVRNLRGAMA